MNRFPKVLAAALALAGFALAQTTTPAAPSKAPAPATPPAKAAAAKPAVKAAGPTAQEIADAKAKGLVWVNTSTKVYHKDGAYFGKTRNGKFLTEDEAKAAGYHAAGAAAHAAPGKKPAHAKK
jgi:hypothetical protein